MNPEKFEVQKLDTAETKRLATVLNKLKEKYNVDIKETSDQVFITLKKKNELGEEVEVTHGFTKIGDNMKVFGNEVRFSEFIEAKIESEQGNGEYETLIREATKREQNRSDTERLKKESQKKK